MMALRSWLAILGILPAIAGWLASPLAAAEAEPPAPKYQRAVLIRFEGTITPLLEQFLYRKLDDAKQDGADLVIVEIDSPGGLVESSFNIAHRLRDLDWAATVAYVPREALSGAAIVALGCEQIIMDPDAVLGDAGPIVLGEDFLFRHAPEKVRSDLARKIRDLAEGRNRPPALAEAMVDMNLVVYEVTDRQTGAKKFMSEHEIKSSPNPDQWEKGPPVLESREGSFLEVNGRRAVELTLAEGNAEQPAAAAATAGADGAAAGHRAVRRGHRRLRSELALGHRAAVRRGAGGVVYRSEHAGPGPGRLDLAVVLCVVLLEPLPGRHGRSAGDRPVPDRRGVPGGRDLRAARVWRGRHHGPVADAGRRADGGPDVPDSGDETRVGGVWHVRAGAQLFGRRVCLGRRLPQPALRLVAHFQPPGSAAGCAGRRAPRLGRRRTPTSRCPCWPPTIRTASTSAIGAWPCRRCGPPAKPDSGTATWMC